MISSFGIDQLNVDTETLASSLYRTFHHIIDVQFSSELLHVNGFALEGERRVARDHERASDARQVGGAAHALIKELTGNNATARVAAARTILEENERTPAGNGTLQVPGFAILIADARAQAMPVGPVLNQISRQPGLLADQVRNH
jgi:hypothetical protein